MTKSIETTYQFGPLDRFNFQQRLVIRVAGFFGYVLVRILGSTIRFQTTDWENFEAIENAGKLPIYSFWHDRIISGTYFFRNRGIIVLSSSSFDSEYTARCIQRLGFGIIKGSSTRGGIQALVGMIRMMKQGFAMAFTIDGPKTALRSQSRAVVLARRQEIR